MASPGDDLAAHLAEVKVAIDRLIALTDAQAEKYRGRQLSPEEIQAARSLSTTYQRLAEIMFGASRQVDVYLDKQSTTKSN